MKVNYPNFQSASMFLIPNLIVLSVLFFIALSGSDALSKKKSSSSDAKKIAEQQISVVGKLGCADNDAVKAKIVLKVSRNGAELKSVNYSLKKQDGSTLISMKRTEPKFLFLEIIPTGDDSKCNKTIKGKVRMREFKSQKGGDKNDRVMDVGDCDFSTGKCTKFSKNPELQNLSIVGTIHCGNNQNVKATIVMKPKRRVEDIIKSQAYNSKRPASSLLEAQTKEPNTVFLQIIPDPSMGPSCSKTVEAKLGMREFKVKGDKGVFDVGKCDLSVGKCTKFPFPV